MKYGRCVKRIGESRWRGINFHRHWSKAARMMIGANRGSYEIINKQPKGFRIRACRTRNTGDRRRLHRGKCKKLEGRNPRHRGEALTGHW